MGAFSKSFGFKSLQFPNTFAETSSKGLINVLNFEILSSVIFIAYISIISDILGFVPLVIMSRYITFFNILCIFISPIN